MKIDGKLATKDNVSSKDTFTATISKLGKENHTNILTVVDIA
ncbi:hypothetical protein [Neobacillus sp. 204]